MSDKQNICKIVEGNLCNTCGGCFSVCPSQAIHFEETTGGYCQPVIDESRCTHCGLCVDVCPGASFGSSLLAAIPEDPFSGKILEAYIGRSLDKKLFDNSQSGGIVSALLVHSLETGRIKGAVTVYMQSGTPPRPVVRIARSREEVCQAQKSKYCPVPLLSFLKDLDETGGPISVVGLPCQIHGLLNILDKFPKLKSKIAFTIGLVCDRALTYGALDFLLHKFQPETNDKVNIHFRDKSTSGYPGDVLVFSDRKSVVIPSATRIRIKDYFTPARCRICFDKMNVFSDITIGDPHGLGGVDRKWGESVVIVRTYCGMDILKSARSGKAITIRPKQSDQILNGQGIDEKKKQWRGYIEAWKQNGFHVPNFYELVNSSAPEIYINKRYLQDLKYSLSLDDFSSRIELIKYVEKALAKKRLINYLFYPLHFVKRIVKKIRFLLNKNRK